MISLPTQGYLLSTPQPDSHNSHWLCGANNVAGAHSPNTGEPLLLQLTLDLADSRLELTLPISKLHLFYSWRCGIHEGTFFYKEDATGVAVLQYSRGTTDPDFPYTGYPDYFPSQEVDLIKVDPAEQAIVDEINNGGDRGFELGLKRPDLSAPRHQVGGRPRLVQPAVEIECPLCNRQMPLLATIGDEATDGQAFTGNPYVQVVYHLCASCTVVGAYNVCD